MWLNDTISAVASWHQRWREEVSVFSEFPFDYILKEFHSKGKHFVQLHLLQELSALQEQINQHSPNQFDFYYELIASYLPVLLDKHRETYDYHTYIASPLLEKFICNATAEFDDYKTTQMINVCALLGDIIRFECTTLQGMEQRFTDDLTDEKSRKKRVYFSVKALKSMCTYAPDLSLPPNLEEMLAILKHEAEKNDALPIEIAQSLLQLSDHIDGQLPPQTSFVIRLSMLPVYTSHDEYMFIRILQCFEMLFGIIAKGFESCIELLIHRDFERSKAIFDSLTAMLQLSPSLFRVLTSMPREHFASFRIYTEGASAIQSRQYKRIEILASHPSKDRVNSAAFDSVPLVKTQYLNHFLNIHDIFEQQFLNDPLLQTNDSYRQLVSSMELFDNTFSIWKNTHYKIAKTMLGQAKGTGYTAGTPYLRMHLSANLFPFI